MHNYCCIKAGRCDKMNNKKKVDLLLINPPFHKRNGSGTIFPLGLGYLISAVRKEGYTCDVINGYSMIHSYTESNLKYFEKSLLEKLKSYEPVLVGIGPCITTQLKALRIIAKQCLDVYGSERVYAGGPLASMEGQEWVFFDLMNIRYIIKGDGEEAICEMLRCLKAGEDLKKCDCVSREGYYYYNQIDNIDDLAFPERPYLLEDVVSLRRKPDKMGLSASMITSRGCKYHCNYCVSGNIKRRNFRKRSNRNIIEEMKLLADKYHVNDIIFYDDCFFSSPKSIHQEVEDFCSLLIAKQLPLTWQMEIRCDVFLQLNIMDLELLKKSGCRQINLGIEKTYVAGLKAIGKNVPLEGLAEQIQETKSRTGIRVAGTFILGGKNETEADIQGIVENSQKLNLDFAHYNPLFVYPGTPLYAGYFTNEREWVSYLLKDNWLWGEIVYENKDLNREKIVRTIEEAYEQFYRNAFYSNAEMIKDRFHLQPSI